MKHSFQKISLFSLFFLCLQIISPFFYFSVSASPASHIIISEVVYDPLGLENEAEWFELFNPTSSPVSLSGWTIKEGGTPSYTFQSGASIIAGGYLVVGNQASDFQLENTGSILDIDMQKTESPSCNSDSECLLLNNSSPGDSLTLKDNLGTTIDFVAWEATSWTTVIGTNGKSISRSSSSDTDTSADWMAESIPSPKNGSYTFTPFITLTGTTPLTVEAGSFYSDAGAMFTSFTGTGNLTASGTVNTALLGGNTLTYNYTDGSGSTAPQVTRTVNIVDTTKPTITLSGSSMMNIYKNTSYTDSGATWTDNYDGTGSLVGSGTVNTSLTGSYILTYDYTDISGNIGTQVTRTVNVTSGNTPIITLIGSGSITQEVGNAYTDLGATWVDVEDGSGSLVGSGTVHTNLVGTYIVSYDYTDISGNTAIQITRTVNIIDTTLPLISLTGSGNIQIPALLGYTDAGATWMDNYDGSGSLVGSGIVNTNLLGTYPITFDFIDTSGNIALQVVRNVTVIAPICPAGSQLLMTGMIPSCVPCDVGRYNSIAGGTCQLADPGYFVGNTGSHTQQICPAGYTSTAGVSACTLIPVSYTPGAGASGNYDRCGPLGDLSGNSRDGICETPKGDIGEQEEVVEQEEIMKQAEAELEDLMNELVAEEEKERDVFTKKIGEKEVTYQLENSYPNCSIVDSLNDTSYPYLPDIFPDIGSSLYKDMIEKFASLKIVNGTKEGNFEATRKISRVEFTKLVLLSHCYTYQEEDTKNLDFTDIEQESWQAKVIAKASTLGIISGDINKDGEKIFRGDDFISKAEATKILMRMAMIQTETVQKLGYGDISIDWLKKYVQIGETLGIFEAQKDQNMFQPNAGVSREEMVHMIDTVIHLYR